MVANKALDLATIEDLRVARVWAEEVVADRPTRLRTEPRVDRVVEEADLRLVDDPIRNESADRMLEHVLRVEPMHLVLRRDRGAVLDEMMIEKRHANLQRVRHRCPVEVMEHVVDEAELAIEVERIRKYPASYVAEALPRDALAGSAVALRQFTCDEPRAEVAAQPAACREQALDWIGGAQGLSRAAE